MDVAPALLTRLGACLSEQEQVRAARFRDDLDRARFVAARGWLRTLLGRYLNSGASEISFAVGQDGKPEIAGGPRWLRFNLAHSERVAVYAVARDREVGVDIERLRPDFPIDEIARHFFSSRERADLAAVPDGDRLRAAFNCWTRKEAYLKAVGTGLLRPLDEFDVTVRPGEPLRLRDNGAGGAGRRRWSLHAFEAGRDYAAAVVVEGGGCTVPHSAWALSPVLGDLELAGRERFV